MTQPHDNVTAHQAAAHSAPPSRDPRPDLPLRISHEAMNAALETRTAVPFSRTIPWITHHLDTWWIHHTTAWLRITDVATDAELTERSAVMREADDAVRDRIGRSVRRR